VTTSSKKQSGFTIIELVMVIVILGILSAFALPRFADFGQDAREASLAGLAGSMKSAAAIAHAEQLVSSGALGDSVSLEGQTITMVNGYPTPNGAGILAAAGITASEFTLTPVAPVATGGASLQIAVKANCYVEYISANAATINVAPLTAGYSVTLETDGCG
jgi:MSHA pilin protein MshA